MSMPCAQGWHQGGLEGYMPLRRSILFPCWKIMSIFLGVLVVLLSSYLVLSQGQSCMGCDEGRSPKHLARRQIRSRYVACRQICNTPLMLVDVGTRGTHSLSANLV